jgi:hypothetical protein
MIQASFRKSDVVFRFYVVRLKLETSTECLDGFGKPILVIPGTAEIVPTGRIRGLPGK